MIVQQCGLLEILIIFNRVDAISKDLLYNASALTIVCYRS